MHVMVQISERIECQKTEIESKVTEAVTLYHMLADAHRCGREPATCHTLITFLYHLRILVITSNQKEKVVLGSSQAILMSGLLFLVMSLKTLVNSLISLNMRSACS